MWPRFNFFFELLVKRVSIKKKKDQCVKTCTSKIEIPYDWFQFSTHRVRKFTLNENTNVKSTTHFVIRLHTNLQNEDRIDERYIRNNKLYIDLNYNSKWAEKKTKGVSKNRFRIVLFVNYKSTKYNEGGYKKNFGMYCS